MNPHIHCVPYAVRLGINNAIELMEPYDVVVDATDNFPSRYLINDACVITGKPLVYGALYTFQGQASVFNYRGGPTYRCLFPEPPRPEEAPKCSEIGVLGILPGLIGLIQATEVIKVITGLGEPLSGKLMTWDALSMRQQLIRFSKIEGQARITELKLIESVCEHENQSSVAEIRPRELQADVSDYQLLDVREDWERAICCLPSEHIPLKKILDGSADFEALGFAPDRPTYVYCKVGVRSLKAAEVMQAHYGFKNPKSLRGGILGWAEEIDTSIQVY